MRVHVIGAGGVGFYLSLSLSRANVEHIVYDIDDMSGGLGYARMPKASPATKKTQLLRGHTIVVNGDRPPTVVDALFTGAEVEAGDLVVDCSDMALGDLRSKTSRKSIWRLARERGARMLRVSYDGQNNTVVVAEGLPMGGAKGGGYASVPSLALSFVAGGLGAIAVMRILAGYSSHVEFQYTVNDNFVVEETSVVQSTEIDS